MAVTTTVLPPNAAHLETVHMTVAQAIVTFLSQKFIEIDGREQRVCAGGFGIFGHGNAPSLGEPLYAARNELPRYRGQNGQSMGFAAAAYAKAQLRRRFMFRTASAGPGTANLLTAAALAHANRLPMLMLCGDNFAARLPDPVLQQLEHFGNPALGVTYAFRAVSRYWDRITHPAQILNSLPAALNTMLYPADCGPAFLALPQDLQGWAYDYLVDFFAGRVHRIRRTAPDAADVRDAAILLASARRPLIIAGGGVQYSGAVAELTAFAEALAIPLVETIDGRANMVWDHPLNIGPIGVTGSDSANTIAAEADVIFAVGTRLQDFTTGSWSAFARDSRIINLNVGRHYVRKHLSAPLVCDAKTGPFQLGQVLSTCRAPADWVAKAQTERKTWNGYVARNVAPRNGLPTYAQAVGAVNDRCTREDRIVAAAGGLPAEIPANWRSVGIGTVNVEFGFSCMGYKIAGGWGARIAQAKTRTQTQTVVFVGDVSYLLMNSDIYSSVLTGHKPIIPELVNGGFAVINKLQKNTGNASFNTLFADCPTIAAPFAVDFAAHARAIGALAEDVGTLDAFGAAFERARAADRTCVIVTRVDPHDGWTEQGHAWWEVGLPETSTLPGIDAARAALAFGRAKQRAGI